jgi:hypothetical protein
MRVEYFAVKLNSGNFRGVLSFRINFRGFGDFARVFGIDLLVFWGFRTVANDASSAVASVRVANIAHLAKTRALSRLPHFADCGGANCGTGACLSASVASLPFRGVSNCGRHLGEYAGNHHPPCRTTKIRQGRPINLRAFTRAAGISLRKSNNLSWALRVGFSAMRTTLIARSTPPSARDLGTFAA